MKNKTTYILLSFILVLSVIVRFFKLGQIPASSNEIYNLRLLSALLGTFTTILIFFLANSLTNSKKIGLFSSFSYTILPLAVVENRIVSWVTIADFFLIFSLLILLNKNSSNKKIIGSISLIITIIFILFKSTILESDIFLGNYIQLIANFFTLASFEKIFIANDTYWIAGLRKYGMINPELIVIFLIGFYQLLKQRNKIILISLAALFIFASVNSKFPEAREIGIVAPFFAVVLGFGFNNLSRVLNNFKPLIYLYFLIILYGIMIFYHYYFVHYSLRIEQEQTYKTATF